MSFADILGQDRAVGLLKADLRSDRVAESYLFIGPHGSGRKLVALEFAKALNCRAGESVIPLPDEGDALFGLDPAPAKPAAALEKPCGECNACRKVDQGTHPDVFVLNFESQGAMLDLKEEERAKQKELRIDSVRSMIGSGHLTPAEGHKRVFIIDGAELLSAESSNALLKVLEESPAHCHWILLAVSLERVLPTVQSRCRKVHFAPLAAEVRAKIRSTAAPAEGRKSRVKDEENLRALEELAGELSGSGALSIKPLQASATVMAEAKKGMGRKQAEDFLNVLVLKLSDALRERPVPASADNLALALTARDELRRNVSPQMVLDALLTQLCHKGIA